MKRAVRRPKSVLSKVEPSIAKALLGGLPRAVKAFYEKNDGVVVTLEIEGEKEHATIEGLLEMFGHSFMPPSTLRTDSDAEAAIEEGAFQGVFYTSELELRGKSGRARLEILLRLKLVMSLPGESAAIGIDFYDEPKNPALYYVRDASEAWPLALGFDELVAHVEHFGARRWYYAFLDTRAERAMNVDLATELEASLAPFDAEEVAALRARLPRAKRATGSKAKRAALAAAEATLASAPPEARVEASADHSAPVVATTPPAPESQTSRSRRR